MLAKVRHSQRMNEALISIWIITEKNGVVVSAHCLGCKAGLAESCSHIACVLFYLESWTKIHGKLACTQMACQWILPPFVKDVEYARARDINFKSAKKLKNELEDCIDNLPGVFEDNVKIKPRIPAPTKAEMDTFYSELSQCKAKPVALSLVSPYADSYVLSSRNMTTVPSLFDKKYLDLTYPELLEVCMATKLEITREQIQQVEKDTISQAKGTNFFKHRAGRIGASQSKAACHTNPALPSQSLIQAICYPELSKFSTKATEHGCKHEALAIRTYEEFMKTKHTNFKVIQCGLIINEEMPWLHATPDFLCYCDCCGEGCSEVKCPYCLDNCDFESYVTKSSACLKKDSQGHYVLPHDHQYYYQVQQQLFTTNRPYCDFVVCAVGANDIVMVQQRILPDKGHWESAVPKLEKFWRACVLPEVLGKWSTRKHTVTPIGTTHHNTCYCRSDKDEDTVNCCNAQCPIGEFHLSCLGVDSTPKTWYCPNCRVLPSCKPAQKKKDTVVRAMKMDSICICNGQARENDKLLECKSGTCKNGTFFHLSCLKRKRMPNNSSSWVCASCTNAKKSKSQADSNPQVNASNAQQHTVNQPSSIPQPTVNSTPQHTESSSAAADVTFIRKVQNVPKSTTDKYGRQGSMGQYEYDLIRDPNGWLDCVVIHEAHILLRQINNNITGFQRPTLGAVRQFDVMTGDFIQILHVNNNHWVCMTSIDCPNGYVIVLDSMISQVSKELQELAKNLVGPTFKGVRKVRVQPATQWQ